MLLNQSIITLNKLYLDNAACAKDKLEPTELPPTAQFFAPSFLSRSQSNGPVRRICSVESDIVLIQFACPSIILTSVSF